MIGEVHKNEVTKNDVQDIYKKFGELSKDVDLLETKMKYTVSVLIINAISWNPQKNVYFWNVFSLLFKNVMTFKLMSLTVL